MRRSIEVRLFSRRRGTIFATTVLVSFALAVAHDSGWDKPAVWYGTVGLLSLVFGWLLTACDYEDEKKLVAELYPRKDLKTYGERL